MMSHDKISIRTLIKKSVIALSFLAHACVVSAQSEVQQGLSAWFFDIGEQGLIYTILALCVLTLCLVFLFIKSKKLAKKLSNELTLANVPVAISTAGLIQLDDNFSVSHCNTAAASLLGRKVENLVNVPITSLFSSSDQSNVEAYFKTTDDQRGSIVLKAQSSQKFLKVNLEKAFNMLGDTTNTVSYVATFVDVNSWINEQSRLSQRLNELEAHHNEAGNLEWELDLKSHQIQCTLGSFASLEIFNDEDKRISFATLESLLTKSSQKIWQNFISQLVRDEGSHAQQTLNLSFIAQKEQQFTHLKLSIFSLNGMVCKVFVQNTTKSTQLKQSADTAEFKLQNIIAMSPEPVYILDEVGKLSACNPAFERQFGLRGTQNKGKLLEQLNIMPDKIAQLHVCAPAKRLNKAASLAGNLATNITPIAPVSAKTIRINQTICFDRDNPNEVIFPQEYENVQNLRKLQIVAQSVRLKDNNQSLVFGFTRDLSEIHHANLQLTRAQSHFENIVNLAPVAIATIDNDDRIVNANTTMLARLGLLEKDLKEGNFFELFNDVSSSGKIAKELHKTGRVRNFFAQLKGKNKELHPSEINIDLFNKDKQEYLCWISDKSAEQFQQDRFESLLNHSSMPMAVLGEHGFSDINPAAMRFFKTDNKQDLLHMHPYSQVLNGEDAEHLKHIITQVKATGQSQTVSWEHMVKQQCMPCHLTLVPLFKGKGFDSILCIWVDLTALKQADQERLYALKLQQKAQAETIEVNKKLQTSQSILASKEKSLAETASELSLVKNNLNEKQSEYQNLKAAHLSVKEHLKNLQNEYQTSCDQLKQVKHDNEALSSQLNESSILVEQLEEQRKEIASRLTDSQEKYEATKHALQNSEAKGKDLERAKETYIQEMENYKQQIELMHNSIHEKDQQITAVGQQITELQSQLNASDRASETLKQQLLKQRRASEKAESQRREFEQKVQIAQTELLSKEANLKHIQSEMQKLEELSSIEKDDMQAMQQKLKNELQQKQAALTQTQVELAQKAKEAEKERNEKQEQQSFLAQLSKELKEIETNARIKEQDLQTLQKERQDLEESMKKALDEKQAQLHEAQDILSKAKQETEAERAEKQARSAALEKLEVELKDLEHKNRQKLENFIKQERERKSQHDEKEQEVAAKKEQLAITQARVSALQKQADDERLARLAQQRKVEQLSKELDDVQARAQKQKEMLEGSDEQFREHHEQIEEQKLAFQKALEKAQQQNKELAAQLKSNIEDLTLAEQKVSTTQSDEQRLQHELQQSKAQAKALVEKLASQEQKETLLQDQVNNQQAALEGRERNIAELQKAQEKLAQQLSQVRSEYQQSKNSMQSQQANQSELADKLQTLESELNISKSQLNEKESALAEVQAQLQLSESEKRAQEHALLAAHRYELKEARNQQPSNNEKHENNNDILAVEMPENPSNWFDLLSYLQGQDQEEPLPVSLKSLLDELSDLIDNIEQAVAQDNRGEMLKGARHLIDIAKKINADGLTDVVSHMHSDDAQVLLDNISIAWPSIKRAIQNTLRVTYSHLMGK
ncbi:PAS domain-containing protein [Glaciecola sp. KUL10]|uniref:PAS domain-containing protein n=1 Tax=Glaciecola sp. (strain KUL10) TaxID=2161813 RepID=UPI000D789C88|nr:PAS domain-containing protein [Glaciecola sp. KUL10]GBL04678.1 hypothetical protein KUL10_19870 [Glaciecola sp. KUL10]